MDPGRWKNRVTFSNLLRLGALLSLLTSYCAAQTFWVVGTVQDPQGAAIANATVTITMRPQATCRPQALTLFTSSP